MEVITIEPVTSKRVVKLCRANGDQPLTVIGSATVTVATDFAQGTETTKYQGKAYAVKGTIYMSYIVVE